MAETNVRGRQYILLVDLDNNASYKAVAALTSNSFSSSLDVIDATSKDGNLNLPGDKYNQSVTASANAIDESGTPAKDGYNTLYAIHVAKTKFAWKMGKASPATGDVVYGGNGYLTELNITADDNDIVKFDFTITPDIPPATQTVTA